MQRRTNRYFLSIALTSLWLVSACLISFPAWSQSPVAIHSISFPERQNQYVHVTLTLPVTDAVVELAMPNWTPGSYVIRDYVAHLERFAVTGAGGEKLPFTKVEKNRWQIETRGSDRVVVDYDIWAGELHVSSSWVESDFALLNGAGVFLYSQQSLEWPQRVEVNLPDSWRQAHAALPTVGAGQQFVAANYDELVDSPIVAGNMVAERFEVDGQGYQLITVGQTEFWDSEKAVADLSRLIREQQDFWQVNPFDRDFLFFNFLLKYKGGLEHDHSTVMMSDRWTMRNRSDTIKWLALASHEFFHSWNVRRMRPEALADYDYDKEDYSRELWLAEGFTSYYDNLMLFRAGLVNIHEYLDMLATEFRNYETVPGREIGTAEAASFDSWIKHYVPDANSVNSTVSYYRRGSLVGFVTDAMIRRETKDKASLDTVMREMYRLYGPDSPGAGTYPPGAFEAVVESVAGSGVRAQVERMVQTRTDPDIADALDAYGLKLDRSPARTLALQAGVPEPAGFGVSWKKNSPLLIIEQVIRGRAAATAGVIPGDELLAINGQRILPGNMVGQINRLRIGDRIELTLSRHGQLLTIPVDVEPAIPESYAITLKTDATRREKDRLQEWLGTRLSFPR